MIGIAWKSAALALTLAQQPPPPVDPRVTGALDPARQPALSVSPPAALTRAVLLDRLKKLDASIPNALPPGAGVVFTPASLRNGRTFIGIYGARRVAVNQGDAAIAEFTLYQGPDGIGEGIHVEFDASGPSRYAIDVQVTGTRGPNPGGGFSVVLHGGGAWAAQHVGISNDGHVLHLFDIPKAGRYTVSVQRDPEPPAGQPMWDALWYFHRVELLRVR